MQQSDWLAILLGVFFLGAGVLLSTFPTGINRLIGSALVVASVGGLTIWFALQYAGPWLNHSGAWLLIIGGPTLGLIWLYAASFQTHRPAASEKPTSSPSLVWDSHLGHSYLGSGASMQTQAFQIGLTNNLGHELSLERAYAISGEGVGEKALLVAANTGWVSVDKTLPIANGQRILFRIEFQRASSREVFENWKTFQITVIYNNGNVIRHDVTEQMVAAVYKSFSPSPIGPQVHVKP